MGVGDAEGVGGGAVAEDFAVDRGAAFFGALIVFEDYDSGAFAEEIARLEIAAQQLTEQYAETPEPGPAAYGAQAPVDPHDAPTLAAPVVLAGGAALPYDGSPSPQTEHIAADTGQSRGYRHGPSPIRAGVTAAVTPKE